MKFHFLHRLHSACSRVVHAALRWFYHLRQSLVRAVAFIKNTVFTVFLVSLLTGCHTSRHVVTHVDSTCVTQTGHREQSMSSQLDDWFSQLSASADSITIVLYDNARSAAVVGSCISTLPCGCASAPSCGATSASTCSATGALHVPAPGTLQDSATSSLQGNVTSPLPGTAAGSFAGLMGDHQPSATARITLHSPRLNKEERHASNQLVVATVADSTRSNTEAHTSTDDSKESIGGAEPPKLTWVLIVLGLGITLLLIGAVFGYLWLHKMRIL